MKTLKIIPPALPNGLTVVSTSWFVNTKDDFSGTVLLEDLNNSSKLFAYPLDFAIDNVAYAKVHMTLSNGNVEKSDIIQLSKYNDNGPESLFVFAPKITYDLSSFRQNIIIQINEPKMFYYTSDHISTTWRLVDSSGVPFYERERDVDNLLSLTIPERVYEEKDAFTIEVVYNFEEASIDVVGRENVIMKVKNANVALSRSNIYGSSDTTIKVLGMNYDVIRVDLRYSIGNYTSGLITLQRNLLESFTISASEASNGLEVEVEMDIITLEGVVKQEVTLDVISYVSSNVQQLTSKAIVEDVNTSLDIYGADAQAYPVSDSKFKILTPTEDVMYELSNNNIAELARITKTFNSYYVTSDKQYFARDLTTIYRLDPSTLEISSQFFKTIRHPATGVGMSDYKGILYAMDDNNTEYEFDSAGVVNNTKPISYWFYIRVTDALTFTAFELGDYMFEGYQPTNIPGNFKRMNYIPTSNGIIAIAFGYSAVEVYYINTTSSTLISTVPISDPDKAVAAYDLTANRIYIIH